MPGNACVLDLQYEHGYFVVARLARLLAGCLDRHGRWPGVIGFETGNDNCDKALVYGCSLFAEPSRYNLQSLGWDN